MSLIDSDHIEPARERHGAHYKLIPRKHDGKLVPGMIYKYEGVGEGWECECGRSNWEFVKECPRCHGRR